MQHETALIARRTDERMELYRQGMEQPLLIQNVARDKRPFIHPVTAPDGIGALTENAPPHHPWQHGLYVGLNDVNGIGFWTERDHSTDGTFHPRPLGGPAFRNNWAAWSVVTEWRAPDGAAMLSERQDWSFTDHGDTYVLDLHWRLTAEIDLRFGQYSYGGLFLRMPYREAFGGAALNSEGRVNGDTEGERARWVAVSMPLEGRDDWAGVAIMDHPDNPEYPVPWRVDGQLGIVPSRCIAGEWNLVKGSEAQFKHRVFVYTGQTDAARIETNFKEFTK